MKKHLVIIVVLVSISISSKAQFDKANGEFFEWSGKYNYTSSFDVYTLEVWGYEGEFTASLTCLGEYDYNLNCTVEFVDVDGEMIWETMYIKYRSVEEGTFIYDLDFEEIAKSTGNYPTMLVLSMIENEIYTEMLDFVIEGVESEKTLKNIFTKEITLEEMIVGSWYEETTAGVYDIIFNEDGSFYWHSGTDEGEASWEIVDYEKLNMFGTDYEILELTETIMKITDGRNPESTFTRRVE